MLFSAGWTLDGTRLTFQELRSETDPQRFIGATWGGRPWEKVDERGRPAGGGFTTGPVRPITRP